MMDLRTKYLDTMDEIMDTLERIGRDPDILDASLEEQVKQQLATAEQMGEQLRYSRKHQQHRSITPRDLAAEIDRLEASLERHYEEARTTCGRLRELCKTLGD